MLSTLTRAGSVLDLFTSDQPEWGVTEAAVALGIPKSLAHNTLVSLTQIGLLQRVGHGRYRLGWRVVGLASTLLRSAALTRHAGVVMRELVGVTSWTAHLIALDRDRLVCLERRHGTARPAPCAPSVGCLLPLAATPSALVLLAGCRAETLAAHWDGGRIRTGHASFDALQAELAAVRARGWTWGQRADPPARALAAPVHGPDGVLAALSLTVEDAMSRWDVEFLARTVVTAADELAARLCATGQGGRRSHSRPAPEPSAPDRV